jgi:hypothetical protein
MKNVKKHLQFTLLLLLLPLAITFSQNEIGTNLFAGVEVGSKGVKISIVALRTNSDGDFSYSVKADSSVNTEIIEFKESSISESAKAVVMFYNKALNDYHIPDRQVFMVISSGVVKQAQITNNTDKIEQLKSMILTQLNLSKKTVDFLTPEVEARLVYLGTIHKKDRNGAVIIDIGSGNTKGGHFDKDAAFTPFDFNWGTAKLKTEINKKQPSSTSEYTGLVKEAIAKIKEDDISTTFNQKIVIRNQPFMIMGGGISWVIVTLMRPDKMDKAFMELSLNDVREFKKMILNSYESFVDDSRATTPDAVIEFGKVKRNFDQKSMIAGASLVEAIMEDLNTTNPTKTYYFARYSSWLTGYLVKSKMGEEIVVPNGGIDKPKN